MPLFISKIKFQTSRIEGMRCPTSHCRNEYGYIPSFLKRYAPHLCPEWDNSFLAKMWLTPFNSQPLKCFPGMLNFNEAAVCTLGKSETKSHRADTSYAYLESRTNLVTLREFKQGNAKHSDQANVHNILRAAHQVTSDILLPSFPVVFKRRCT